MYHHNRPTPYTTTDAMPTTNTVVRPVACVPIPPEDDDASSTSRPSSFVKFPNICTVTLSIVSSTTSATVSATVSVTFPTSSMMSSIAPFESGSTTAAEVSAPPSHSPMRETLIPDECDTHSFEYVFSSHPLYFHIHRNME